MAICVNGMAAELAHYRSNKALNLQSIRQVAQKIIRIQFLVEDASLSQLIQISRANFISSQKTPEQGKNEPCDKRAHNSQVFRAAASSFFKRHSCGTRVALKVKKCF
jgi:hypothetical protein